jgi:succinate-semialdehyde dehydrogenase/glutarate-semialdehyde dehydrogenase
VTAQRSWRSLPVTERCGTAARIRQLITDEMGKPIAEAEAEIEKCAVTCEHYAAHAPEYLAA